jgi:hypothetical protein
MPVHSVLLLSVLGVWFGGLVGLLLWGSWRVALAWAASAALTSYAAWLHEKINAAMDHRHRADRQNDMDLP